MGWKDRISIVYGVVLDKSIDFTASALNACGTGACVVGGAGFAAASVISKTFRVSYYGSANAWGGLVLDARLAETDRGLNYTLPIHINGKQDGGADYSLTDHIDSNMVRMAGAVFIASGMVLRGLGSNLKKWQQNRNDNFYHKAHYGVAIDKPSSKEYFCVNAESICFSLTLAMFSNNIANCIIYYSEFMGSNFGVNYGPVQRGAFPIDIILDSTNITLPVGDLYLSVKAVVDVTANLTYGGGVFFQSNGPTKVPAAASVAVTAAVGLISHVAGTFFAQKDKHYRDERIYAERSDGYRAI